MLLLGLGAGVRCAPAPSPPNLLLIVIDSLRADRLGTYGEPRGTSPYLDRFAREGQMFDRMYATTTWTLGSVGSMLLGRWPSELALTQLSARLPDDVVTLAELLQQRGFATGAVVSHALVSGTRGFSKGFEKFDEREAQGFGHVSTPGVTTRAERILGEIASGPGPFFLFVHYFDPHFDYHDHPQYPWAGAVPARFGQDLTAERAYELHDLGFTPEEIRWLSDCYDEEVRFTDEGVGRLLQALDETGEGKRTLVVVVADHGEELVDHGRLGHGREVLLPEVVVRVPFAWRGPRISRGQVTDAGPISLVALRSSLLRRLGIDDPSAPGKAEPFLMNRPGVDAGRNVLVEFLFERMKGAPFIRHAWIGSRWKVVSRPPHPPELYDLVLDPAEREDFAPSSPALADSLSDALDAAVATLPPWRPEPGPRTVISEQQREQLKALGYTE